MQLTLEQLAGHLAGTLAPVYVMSGDEPLQLSEALDAVRATARRRGYTERAVLEVARDFDWGALAGLANSPSLFAEGRIIELRMPGGKPGDAGAKALTEHVQDPDPSALLLVSSGKLDARSRKTRWYQSLDRAGVTVQVWPIRPAELPGWIRRRMQHAGLKPTPAACAELAQRVEGNLLACVQEIEKLRLLHGSGAVDTDAVLAAAADSARFDTFNLVDYTLEGNAGRALRVLRGLRAEEVPPVLVSGTLAWQVRTLAGLARQTANGASLGPLLRTNPVWLRRKAAVQRALERHPPDAWLDMLCALERIDRVNKGLAPGDPWDEIDRLCLALCGVVIP